MKKFLAGLSLCLGGFCLVASAHDDELGTWMKTLGAQMGSLSKMESKSGPDAVAGAEKISATYGQLTDYFAKKSVDDATKWSQEGKSAADDLVAAAKAGDSEKAGAALKAVGGTCRSCHTAHREKGEDGHYKYK